jgi:ribosomal protein S18 acetylase RimI-like enzyme
MEELKGENGKTSFVGNEQFPGDIITITAFDYLTAELAEKIALLQWNTKEPRFVNAIRHLLYEGKTNSDCFNVVASNSQGDVVGRLYCLQNMSDPHLWYYGDLTVDVRYRRLHIASQMLLSAINTLQDRGCRVLRTYVEPGNIPSINLQRKFGFAEKSYEPFDWLSNEGQLMFEKELEPYNAVLATVDDAAFITVIYGENVEALHGRSIMYSEWQELLSAENPDEAHFLINRGAMPCAWLKINGLPDPCTAWISALAVEPRMQRQGCGTYALRFAEEYIRNSGKRKIRVKIAGDNIPAVNLFRKLKYNLADHCEFTTGDGKKRKGYTFEKTLE